MTIGKKILQFLKTAKIKHSPSFSASVVKASLQLQSPYFASCLFSALIPAYSFLCFLLILCFDSCLFPLCRGFLFLLTRCRIFCKSCIRICLGCYDSSLFKLNGLRRETLIDRVSRPSHEPSLLRIN